MRPIVLTTSGVSNSVVAVMDTYQNPFTVGLGLVVTGNSTVTVQHTFSNLLIANVTPVWFSHPTLAGSNASADGNYAFPVQGIRLTQSGGNGAAQLTVIQSGMPGR